MISANTQLLSKAKEIIKKILNAGSEAYMVGDTLRNLLLDIENKYLEIYTSMSIEGIEVLFGEYKLIHIDDYHTKLGYLGCEFLISYPYTYPFKNKLAVKQEKRHYSSSLMDFIINKDYTVDCLAMGTNNVVYDCFNGKDDLNRKRLQSIYHNPKVLFENMPFKMLEAVKKVSITGFKLDKKVIKAIKAKRKKIRNVSREVIASLMKDIIKGKYFKKSLKVLIKTGLYRYLSYYSFELKNLYNNYRNEDFDVILAVGLVKDRVYDEVIAATSTNEANFHMMVNLAIVSPQADYDNFTLYSNGLDICLKANAINVILKRSPKKQKQITKSYNELPIKKTCDLAFKGEDVLKLTNDDGGEYLPKLMDEIVSAILFRELKNKYEDIKEFVIEKLKAIHFFDKTNNNSIGKDELKVFSRPTVNNSSSRDYNSSSRDYNSNSRDYNSNNSNSRDYNSNSRDYNSNSRDYNKTEEKEMGTSINDFQEVLRKQADLERRVRELESQDLRKELEREIDRRIKESGILEGVAEEYVEKTRETLWKVYYDTLVNTDKYSKLKGNNNG